MAQETGKGIKASVKETGKRDRSAGESQERIGQLMEGKELEPLMEELKKRMKPLNEKAMEECRKRWDSIAKPLHSLGRLEDGIIQIAGITGSSQVCLEKKALVILCADNGVVAEGVTQTGSEITALVAENFLSHNSCACIMAEKTGTHVYPIDVGMNRDTRVPRKKTARGTKNMAKEPAMSKAQAAQAIKDGMETVFELKEKGYNIIATGEMGIGNTTTSSAVASVLLDLPAETLTGRGAGLSKEGLEHKIQVIEEAIHRNKPDKEDPLEVLAKVGGFDLAGLTGVFLGGVLARIPIVIDGFISAAAALTAVHLVPEVKDFILASHVSGEKAGGLLLEALGAKPCITCEMCLGEGTGALTLFPLLDLALEVYNRMSTFHEIEMEAYQPL